MRHLLIAAHGSAFSTESLRKSLRFASEMGGRVSVSSATEPFDVLSLARNKSNVREIEAYQEATMKAMQPEIVQTQDEEERRKEQDDFLEEALEETFPASDPIAPGHPTSHGTTSRTKQEDRSIGAAN